MGKDEMSEKTEITIENTFIEELKESINSRINEDNLSSSDEQIMAIEEMYGGVITNVWDLYNQDVVEVPFLIQDIIPKGCMSSIIAPSESNKTNFTYGAAVAICSSDNYLGFDINAEHNRVLVIQTEDVPNQATVRFKKQLKQGFESGKYTKEILERVDFAFGVHDVYEFMKNYLINNQADCIFIDTYSDIIEGDSNSIEDTRKNLNQFHALSLEYNIAIVFNYHVKKGSERTAPSKNDAIGSVGFEGKFRHIVGLRVDKSDPRKVFLMILKTNIVSSEKKKYATVLRLDDNLNLINTNEQVLVCEVQLVNASSGNSIKERNEKVQELHKSGKSQKEIIDELSKEGIEITQSAISKIINKNN